MATKAKWLNAKTVGEASDAARDFAQSLRKYAEQQVREATGWTAEAGNIPAFGGRAFCEEQAERCVNAAANMRRHADAFDRWAKAVTAKFTPDACADEARSTIKLEVEGA